MQYTAPASRLGQSFFLKMGVSILFWLSQHSFMSIIIFIKQKIYSKYIFFYKKLSLVKIRSSFILQVLWHPLLLKYNCMQHFPAGGGGVVGGGWVSTGYRKEGLGPQPLHREVLGLIFVVRENSENSVRLFEFQASVAFSQLSKASPVDQLIRALRNCSGEGNR